MSDSDKCKYGNDGGLLLDGPRVWVAFEDVRGGDWDDFLEVMKY